MADETISFRIPPEELEALNQAVQESGLSRSDFIRQRLAEPANHTVAASQSNGQASTQDTHAMLKHILLGLHSLHVATLMIPEVSGALSATQTAKIAETSLKESHKMLTTLDSHIGEVHNQQGLKTVKQEPKLTLIQEPTNATKHSAPNLKQEIKADGLSRSI